jgi:alanyl-tRNA synthetase
MQSKEIRRAFSDYFIRHGHTKIASSPLIPQNDPTLLFANAGMNQFKDYFTGKAQPHTPRAVTIQKCVRAGGKHNDLENVGHTPRHHTFFEMLGNFSFGDYFKDEAIRFAWELLTKELGLPKSKLFVTVHHSDDEAMRLWQTVAGLQADRIFKRGDKDNFWEMGEFGPCGPCSEIFFDHGEKHATPGFKPSHGQSLLDDESRYVELWNLVFMQYEKTPQGQNPLPRPSIDTGAGLERVTAALQGVYWNYDTDVFRPIFDSITKLTGIAYSEQLAFRVVADHIRACTMLITDGVIPSNEGRGYVLRRIIRRAVRYFRELGMKDGGFYKLVPSVISTLGEEYPANAANASLATKFLELEEKKFLETLDAGMKFLSDSIAKNLQGKILPGQVAFKLYDTCGFPLDLTEVILHEQGLSLDQTGFHECMKQQREQSQKSWKGACVQADNQVCFKLKEKFGASVFTGYESETTEAKLLARETIGDKIALIFDRTPFYPEGGGQIGDSGTILENGKTLAHITDTLRPVEGLSIHLSSDSDILAVGKTYTLAVDHARRQLIRNNHTATHLLQAALRKVLGNHVAQSGSMVSDERLRFDFTHPTALTDEECRQVEDIVNTFISNKISVNHNVMGKDEAIASGALAFFGEKYGDKVRVLKIGDVSTELCGGTHVSNTKDIGHFWIDSESSVSAGVRRIEGLTGAAATKKVEEKNLPWEERELTNRTALATKKHLMSSLPEAERPSLNPLDQHLEERELFKKKYSEMTKTDSWMAIKLIEERTNLLRSRDNAYREWIKKLQRMEERAAAKDQTKSLESLFSNQITLKGGMGLGIIEAPQGSDLKQLSDTFVDKHPSGILLLYAVRDAGASILLRTNKNNTKIDCAKILKASLALLNGSGGGRADMAQGSAKDMTRFEEFKKQIKALLLEDL